MAEKLEIGPSTERLYDASIPVNADDPYSTYRVLRDAHPVYRSPGDEEWVLSRHDDVALVLGDSETFAITRSRDEVGDTDPMGSSDPPRHDELRALMRDTFSPKAIKLLETWVERRVRDLVEELSARTNVDLAAGFTWVLGMSVASRIFAIAEEEQATLLERYLQMTYLDPTGWQTPHAQILDRLQALADERRAHPGDDPMSLLMLAVSEGSLDRRDAVPFLWEVFDAGVDTAASALGNALLALGRYPDQRELLRSMGEDEPSLKAAVEELIRFDTPIQTAGRVPTEDVTFHDHVIPKGEEIIVVIGSVNRDERRFPDPDRLDITRPPMGNMAFGTGIHFCIGAPLARLVSRIALPIVVDRLPNYELAGPAVRTPVGSRSTTRTLLSLPVAV